MFFFRELKSFYDLDLEGSNKANFRCDLDVEGSNKANSRCDLDVEGSNSIFPHDTPAHGNAPSLQSASQWVSGSCR